MQQRISNHVRAVIAVAAAAMSALATTPASGLAQTTLSFGTPGGFGGLQCVNGANPVDLASYGGFAFNGLRSAQPSGFAGQCTASNSGLTTSAFVTAIGGGAFNFQSARFASAFPTAGTTVTVTGLSNGNQVFQNTLTLGTSVGAGTLFQTVGTNAITRLEITQTGANPFVLDDFTTGPASVVPEPGTWVLLGGGLALLVPFARRRRV